MSATTEAPVPVPRRLLRVAEAAEALAVSEPMVWKLIKTGALRSIKVGNARRIPVDALDEFVEHQAATGGEAA